MAQTPWERFASEPEKYGSAERFLQIAVGILDYLDVDRAIVFDVVRHRLGDLRDLHRTLVAAHLRG